MSWGGAGAERVWIDNEMMMMVIYNTILQWDVTMCGHRDCFWFVGMWKERKGKEKRETRTKKVGDKNDPRERNVAMFRHVIKEPLLSSST